jgi:oxygen-dependent protoporphyrinogen oxidase
LQRLIDRLSEILEPQLRLQTSLVHWQRDAQGCYQVQFSQGPPQLFDAVVLACPAPEQARLLRMIPGAPAVEFEKIPYTAISVVGLGYRQIDTPQVPEGFGYIAASRQRRDVIGVQWCSSIFPDRAPAGHVLWRALVGGAGRPEAAAWDDATLVTKVHEEMQQLLGVRGRPVFQEIIRWPQAIPQYHLGHPERVARIEQALSQLPGLYSAGNSLHGVAMNDVVEQSDCLAARILAASAPV